MRFRSLLDINKPNIKYMRHMVKVYYEKLLSQTWSIAYVSLTKGDADSYACITQRAICMDQLGKQGQWGVDGGPESLSGYICLSRGMSLAK
jgi:hypothetical protein